MLVPLKMQCTHRIVVSSKAKALQYIHQLCFFYSIEKQVQKYTKQHTINFFFFTIKNPKKLLTAKIQQPSYIAFSFYKP